MQCRGRSDAGFAGLAGNIDLHAQAVAQPACFEQRVQATELDGLETYARSRAAGVVALNVFERMDALVGADRHFGCDGNARHAVEIFRAHRLLEEIEAAIGEPRDIAQRFVDAKTLIGIGRHEARLTLRLEQSTDVLRARRIRFGRSKSNLDLESPIAGRPTLTRLAQIRNLIG